MEKISRVICTFYTQTILSSYEDINCFVFFKVFCVLPYPRYVFKSWEENGWSLWKPVCQQKYLNCKKAKTVRLPAERNLPNTNQTTK